MANQEVRKISINCNGSKNLLPRQQIKLTVDVQGEVPVDKFVWETGKFATPEGIEGEAIIIEGVEGAGNYKVRVRALDKDGKKIARMTSTVNINSSSMTAAQTSSGSTLDMGIKAIDNLTDRITDGGRGIPLQTRNAKLTPNKSLFVHIRESTHAIGFKRFKVFADSIMCGGQSSNKTNFTEPLRFRGEEAFNRLRACADDFLSTNVGVDDYLFTSPAFTDNFGKNPPSIGTPDIKDAQSRLKKLPKDYDQALKKLQDNGDELLEVQDPSNPPMLPYSEAVRDNRLDLPLKYDDGENCTGLLAERLTRPLMLELIWSYWMEEGMLVQSLNAILTRFQNRKVPGIKGGLDHLNISPLRPLANLLWGYVQNPHRPLSVRRRAMEYLHEYGFKLKGKALDHEEPVETRTTFIRALHSLLNTVSSYYRELADTTRAPSAFNVLNSLREVHMVLAEGAHNQYGDLPYTARRDMLIQSWILARPEIRDFLRGRDMVPYPEGWMQSVDQLKNSAGWSPVSVRHFRDLAVFGERILLSARFGNWGNIYDENEAALWAEYFRQEVQGYIHAYKTVTGVDLAVQAVADQKDVEQKWSQSPSDLIIMGSGVPAE